MARAIVTQEAVAEAAAQLVAAGEEPSIINVQARIGGGSFSTVKRYLDAWKEAQAAVPAQVEAPPAVQEQAAAFGRAVWQAAVALAEQQIAQVRAEAERQVAQARASEAEAMQAVTRLETQLEELAQQLVAAQQERDAARGALDEAVLAEQRAQARLEEQRERLTDLHRQVEAQATELSQARADLLAQAKLAGEVEALRRQMADESRNRRSGTME
jgi:chromosome segregation ATPase